jgi:hypothetical protein
VRSANEKKIFEALVDHGVDFVVIGAAAAILQGAPIAATMDLDVTAATTRKNLERLAAALRDLEASLRLPDPEEHVDMPLDARILETLSVVTLMTRFGPFDVLFAPSGSPGYPELRANAVEVAPFGLVVRVASIEDLISMKRAAGREKDALHLEVLLKFLEETDGTFS